MKGKLSTIDESALNKPILLPDHPYVAALKNFGTDEFLAGFVDAFSTTFVSHFLKDQGLKKIILPLTGPILEKVMFFPAHFKRAYDMYKNTPVENRQPFKFYFKTALKNGTGNLIKDILLHDPLYILFMSLGLHYATNVPAGLLSASSYIVAVLLVAAIDVTKDELLFKKKKKMLEKLGFKQEKYYEARFYVNSSKNRDELLNDFKKRFNLENVSTIRYYDTYFDTIIQTYSGRRVRMRIRTRQKRSSENHLSLSSPDKKIFSTAQIVYTRAREDKKGIDQVRYFLVEKEKLEHLLPKPTEKIEGIPDEGVKKFLEKYNVPGKPRKVSFERTVANNDQLAICIDKMQTKRPFYVVELKSFKDKELLRKAMRYLMVECPVAVMQTTHGKSDIIKNQPKNSRTRKKR